MAKVQSSEYLTLDVCSSSDTEWPSLVASTKLKHVPRPSTATKCLAVETEVSNPAVLEERTQVKLSCKTELSCYQLQTGDESTDAGSSASDNESTCSSACDADSRKLHGYSQPRRASATSRKCRFQGTVLDTIPGTPVGKTAPMSASPCTQAAGQDDRTPVHLSMMDSLFADDDVIAAAPAAPCSLPRMPSPLPFSPKRQRREAMLVRARRDRVPLKARVPEYGQMQCPILDRTIPAKKRPPFPELGGITAAGLKMNPEMPAKKKVTEFLLEDFPRFSLLLELGPGQDLSIPTDLLGHSGQDASCRVKLAR